MVVVPVICWLLGPLARVPQEPRDEGSVIAWWELRRIPYNLIAGILGIPCIVLSLYIDTLPPQLPPDQTDFDYFLAIFAGPFVINFFYTGGWVCEIALRSLTKWQVPWFGPVMFSLGLLFLVVLVASNIFSWLFRVVIGRETWIGMVGADAALVAFAALLLADGVRYGRRRWPAG